MRVGYGLNVEQVQKLIMTPELRQAITILQLSAIELVDYIQQEVLENPLLEVKDDEGEAGEAVVEEKAEATSEKEKETFDIDWQEYFSDRSDLGYIKQPREEQSEYSYENYLAKDPSLHETLMLQLDLVVLSDLERRIGRFLIGCINDTGYLQVPLEEVAKRFGASLEQVEVVLKIIQSFDPPGIAARNLGECLRIQLVQMNKLTPMVERVVEHHLEDLAKGRINHISSQLGISPREVQEIADLIRSLNPKPGNEFGSLNDIRYIIPDVIVERVNNEYVVLVNDTAVPRLGLNNTYHSLLTRHEVNDSEARKYLEGRLNSAAWLIRSIEQRRLTLYRVASCIVNIQTEFLERGVKYLKPMNLRQVAEIVGVHESTVSRATANKYIQTPQGVFEMKFFFTSGVEDEMGSRFSSQSIKRMIKDLIEAEDPSTPLSDQKLASILKQKGIPVSRRTVAKYRSEAGLATTSQRKRY
ncbi:MAG: RNA polymerase factor sigma-54 [Firmicutes bacterium]|nr:RNA polymerase factor sigma-54 [Bacillota bacterium]